MNITTVLFDLDGTLLPMNQNEFSKGFIGLMVKKVAPYGYEPKQFVDAVWSGVRAMMANDGKKPNVDVHYDTIAKIYGDKIKKDKPLFDEYYANEFQGAKVFCGYNEMAAFSVKKLKEMGLRIALATNPLFPKIATEYRIRWAGLEPSDFELYTTYEDFSYGKPNPEYYREVLRRLNAAPRESIMVGNDVLEDMAASEIGMKVFLLTDCLINTENKDISVYPNGGFDEMLAYISSCI